MDPAHPLLTNISSVSFSPLLSSDIRAISVLQITNPSLLDNNNVPSTAGLYDPRLGPLDFKDICWTCHQLNTQCPGHFGHIELNVPVFHPLFMQHAYQLLRSTCFFCHHFLCSELVILRYAAKLKLLEHGLPIESDAIDDFPTSQPISTGKRSAAEGPDHENEDQEVDQSSCDLTYYKNSISKFVSDCLDRKESPVRARCSGDDYKIGMCFDRRRQVISELFKLLPRKKCERCGAYSSRMRKDGHTKIMEYSLVNRQEKYHKLTGRIRPNVLKLSTEPTPSRRSSSAQPVVLPGKRQRTDHEPDDGQDSGDENSDDGASAWAQKTVASRSNFGDAPSEDADDIQEQQAASSREDDDESDTASTDDQDDENTQKDKGNKASKQVEQMMLAQEARAHLRRLFMNEPEICGLLYGSRSPALKSRLQQSPASADMFFLDVVPVPPSRFRPAAIMGGVTLESPQNQLLTQILSQTIKLRDLNSELATINRRIKFEKHLELLEVEALQTTRAKLYRHVLEACVGMQVVVNSLMDSTKNPTAMGPGKLPPQGIKQLLEKKEGLFRMNMMGKRVNYAARSVISPDINIETNEIGVPPVFAKKLTFPEFVTAHNYEHMHRLVCNGPHKHPGAVFVQDEDGTMISLDKTDEEGRRALANTLLNPSSDPDNSNKTTRPDVGLPTTRTRMRSKRVHRHLDDGDILILNRQPTLHKPSMMCHRARILKGEKTIRMHYANCNSYNADFDGDEMNMHFPQSLIAQSEARMIANNDNQYLVPTSGNPLRGLIQDHVVSGVWMTNKDTFFDREDYNQIIYGALRPEGNYSGQGRVVTVPPAIWKPVPLWTGKQLISTIMKNITPLSAAGLNLHCASKVRGQAWGIHAEEGGVTFMDGDLLNGVIDKSQIGASPYGLVHSVYDLYGAEVAGKLLGILSRLFTKFLQHRAFTCRMDDLQLTKRGDEIRSRLISETSQRGIRATLSTIGLSEKEAKTPHGLVDLENRLQEVLRDDMKMAALDNAYSGENSSLQTAINNQCLPAGLAKPFPWNNMQMMTASGAKGTPVNASQISCLLGQQALEGRRVPVMVSGKTLPSFRAFETAPRAGGFVAQRFLTGIRPQEYYFHCMAGREGLIDTAVKTSRSGYLQRCLIKHLEGIRVHYDHTVRNSDSSILQFHYGDDSLDVTKQKHLYQFDFSLLNRTSLISRFNPQRIYGRVDCTTAADYTDEIVRASRKGALVLPPPTLSIYSPGQYIGSVSERFAVEVKSYQHINPLRVLKSKKVIRKKWPEYCKSDDLVSMDLFNSLMHVRFMMGLVDPGEAVGLLAAQGVGEPSTQMTLNTFHFAGHGAANVTLGIPRLREIVMTASANIKTPTMKFPIRPEVTDEEFERFIKKTARLHLSQVVDEVLVTERLKRTSNSTQLFKVYEITLQLYPAEEYCREYSVNVTTVFKAIGKAFVPMLERLITRELKTLQSELKNQLAEIGKGKSSRKGQASGADAAQDGEEDVPARRVDEADIEDGDAYDEKRARQQEELDYDKDGVESDSEAESETMNDEKLRKMTGTNKARDEEGSDDGTSSSMVDSEDAQMLEEREISQSDAEELVDEVRQLSIYVNSIEFDQYGGHCRLTMQFPSSSPKLLLVGLIEESCRRAVIQEIKGITRTLVAQSDDPDKERRYGMTEGANLLAAWDFGNNIIELSELYSNDINAMLRTYGVEAARSSIIKEISGVFNVYGISVDYRHLTILADYMTSEGRYKPFNRSGLANNVSPFLKASYETTATILTDATIFGDFDNLLNPSASIVLGQPPMTGTNSFDILVKT
ncbi:hypothetical protein PCANC_05569 [Puccinia coronata f. sp. avenae]|uniref:DNA-directed RNA polymerase subunit n=1 Tax=Puccinia coronata f. sp. avenae TaxID=200324 RepID=A0A2N5VJD6_9BASI|nr:hypothetical protein PCASD_01870 [Puccinia coronata f. sp. avenae]PLW51806.1 hypothetical protein PCANC_05569 [Puccinia coronata f. sp. avenae]